jgi:hypothetical protein
MNKLKSWHQANPFSLTGICGRRSSIGSPACLCYTDPENFPAERQQVIVPRAHGLVKQAVFLFKNAAKQKGKISEPNTSHFMKK